MERVVIEQRLRDFFKARAAAEGIAAAWLFGSMARGTARPDSDVDVGVLFRENPPRTLAGYHFDLEADLQEVLGLPVQLVVLNSVFPELAVTVLRQGRLLVDYDRARRIDFEVRARFEHWDLEPYHRLCRKIGVREMVDPRMLEEIVTGDLDDLLAFVRAIRERLASE